MTWKLNKREMLYMFLTYTQPQITKKNNYFWLITFFFQASESENFIEKMTHPLFQVKW
jgi:hypothetical protein